jgi:D-tyrosyl-tRNA(Tyr) deacylase
LARPQVIDRLSRNADARKGRRPAFIDAEVPERAEPLVSYFVQRLRAEGVPTQTGVFHAMMQVEIHNDGPVTIFLEKELLS